MIRGYSLLEKEKGKAKVSPALFEVASARFFLMAYFAGVQSAADGWLSLYFEREADASHNALSVHAVVKISLMGRGGESMTRSMTEEKAIQQFKPDGEDWWGWEGFGQISAVERPPYLVDDTLVIELEVTCLDVWPRA